MEIKMNGELMCNEWAEVYRYFGVTDLCCPSDIENALNEAKGEEVTVVINSPGGDLFAGKEILSALQRYEGRVTALVSVMAASAATVAMMGADEVVAEPYATICIHNPSSYCEGMAADMRKAARELETHKESIIAAYKLRSGRTEEELSAKMDKDEWMTAEEALEYGIIDRIADSEAQPGQIAAARVLRGAPSDKMAEMFRAAMDEKAAAERETERVAAEMEAERERLLLIATM